MRPALKGNDKALSQLSFGTKNCIWPKGGLRNTFYLSILRLLIVSEKRMSDGQTPLVTSLVMVLVGDGMAAKTNGTRHEHPQGTQ